MFDWTEECEQTYEELKQKLVNVPVLTIPEGSESFVIHNNTSKQAI